MTRIKSRIRFAAATLVVASAVVGAAATAQGASHHLRVTVHPGTVVAGNAVTVGVAGARGRCTLSIRRDRPRAPVRLRERVRHARTLVAVPASSMPGRRVLGVRCGSQTAHVRFTVLARPSTTPHGKGQTLPPQPVPDEQGFVGGNSGTQDDAPVQGQLGGGDYPNSRIADIALSHLGQNLYTPGALDHGQCKQAVNDWVAVASGGTQRMGVDYYSNYARNGGTQVSRDGAVKGDVIQLDNPADISNYYHGMHTAVVVAHAPGSDSFTVVDSNFALDDTVREHAWSPYQAGQKYGLRVTIWRMGAADSGTPGPAPAPTPAPAPAPAPAAPTPSPSFAETVGGNTNTWTNYANAGGAQGATIPNGTSVQVSCKVGGFRVADGDTWWYRIASSPWNGTYYASADAFYNNGQTSGSLHGTPFADGNVPTC
jgi:hypothetical protein